MRTAPDKESGFGLLEAIIALAIVSLALGALTRAQGTALRAAGRVELHQAALRDARAHVDSLAAGGSLRSGTTAGTYADGLGWRLNVAALGKAAAPTGDTGEILPYWIVLQVADRLNRPLVQLETAKLAREAQ